MGLGNCRTVRSVSRSLCLSRQQATPITCTHLPEIHRSDHVSGPRPSLHPYISTSSPATVRTRRVFHGAGGAHV